MASTAAVLNVIVSAQTGQATAALARVDKQLKGTAASGAAANTGLARFGVTGKQVAAGGLAALAYGSYKALKASVEFEDAFSNVRKTVEGSDAELDKIASGIRQMALEIPVGVNELANLAAQAGALGVPTKDLLEFTKVSAQLGVTTDMAAEDAANALARIGNVMGASQGDFSRMASTLVDLGNKGASTEGEITEMALRFVGVAKQVGLSTQEVLGFSAALANVGEEAEAGGSAMSRAFIEMGNAVGEGGAKLDAFARVAGVSAEAFSREFAQRPAQAMVRFVSGLAKVRKEGGNVFQVLDRLGLSEIRVRRALLALAGKPKQLAKALGIAADAWQKNTANQDEFAKKADTTKSKLQLLKNAANDLAITLGDDLRPALDVAADGLTEFFQGINRELGGREGQTGWEKLTDSVREWRDLARDAFGKSDLGRLSDISGQVGARFANGLVLSVKQMALLNKGMTKFSDLTEREEKQLQGLASKLPTEQLKRFFDAAKGEGVGKAVNQIKRLAGTKVATHIGLTGDAEVTRQLGAVATQAAKIGNKKAVVKILASNESAMAKLRQLQNYVNSLRGKTVDAKVLDKGSATVRAVKNELDSIHDKTVTLTVRKAGDSLSGWASGGRNLKEQVGLVGERGRELMRTARGWTMLGEKGPHLAAIPEGADIFTASETRKLLAAGVPGFAGGKKPHAKPQGNRWEALLAAAELTPGTADDITAINKLIGYWTRQAKKYSKPVKMAGKRGRAMDWGQLTNARQQIKSYRDMLADLTGGASATDADSGLIDLLRSQLATANLRYAVSQAQGAVLRSTPYVGSFAGGGTVPGPIGAPALAVVHGGEAIGQPGNVLVIVEDGAVDARKIRVIAGEEAQRFNRRGGRAVGRTPGLAGAL